MYVTTCPGPVWRTSLISLLLGGFVVLGFLVWQLAGTADKTAGLAADTLNRPEEAAMMNNDDAVAIATRLQSVATRGTVEWPSLSASKADEPKPQLSAGTSDAQLHLVGVMQTGAGLGRALIRTSSDSQGRWMSVGDVIKGWQLRQVSAEKAVMETGGKLVELQLYDAPLSNGSAVASLH